MIDSASTLQMCAGLCVARGGEGEKGGGGPNAAMQSLYIVAMMRGLLAQATLEAQAEFRSQMALRLSTSSQPESNQDLVQSIASRMGG